MTTARRNGFTAFELMVAMAVVAVLLATAVPALKNYTWNLRMKSAMDLLQSDLNLARGRAISHNTQTVICPVGNIDTCSGQSAWQNGWVVFADLNGDRDRQDGEPLIRHADAVAFLDISSPASRSHLRFFPNGSAPGSNASILFCDARGANHAGIITVSNSGRIRARTNNGDAAEICP